MTLIAALLVILLEHQGAIVFVDSGGDHISTFILSALFVITIIGDIRRAFS